MLGRNNPNVDVDRLVLKIQDAVALRDLEEERGPMPSEYARPPTERAVRLLLATAESKTAVRTQWSGRLAVFPFTIPRVQRAVLGALGYLFKDQRHVNYALIEATRELLVATETLYARVQELEAREAARERGVAPAE